MPERLYQRQPRARTTVSDGDVRMQMVSKLRGHGQSSTETPPARLEGNQAQLNAWRGFQKTVCGTRITSLVRLGGRSVGPAATDRQAVLIKGGHCPADGHTTRSCAHG